MVQETQQTQHKSQKKNSMVKSSMVQETQQTQHKSQKSNPNIGMKLKVNRKPSSPPQIRRSSKTLQKCNEPSIQTRRAICKRKYPSSASCSKQSAGLDIIEERMGKKHKYISELTREAPKAQVHPDSIALPTKKITVRDYMSTWKPKGKGGEKKIVPGCMPNEGHTTLEQKPSLKIKDAGNSTSEEHFEGLVTLHQNLALENKSSGSDAGNVLNDLQKRQMVERKCNKRMNMIIQEREEKIQKIKKNYTVVEMPQKLEIAMNRIIWGKGSDKLKIEVDKFAKIVADKHKDLTDLNAKYQAKIKEEIQKQAHWRSVAKAACISSESETHILGTKDVVTSTQHGEITKSIKTVRGKQVVQSNNSDCAKAEEVGCNAPNGNPSNSKNSCQKIEGGITFSDISIPAFVEQINPPKHLGNGESICANLPASGGKVPGEMQPHELHGNVNPVESLEIVDNANPVDLSTNTPIEGFGKGGANDLPDAEKLTQPKHFGCGERIFANLPNSGGSVPGEMQSLELHGSITAELPETIANEIVDNVNPVDLCTNIPIQGFGEEHAIDLPDAELLNQPKHFGSGEIIFANLPDSGGVPGEMLSLAELPETAAAANEIEDNANPADLITNTPIEGFGEEDAIDLPDAELHNQPKHFGSGEIIFANLPDTGERVPGEILSLAELPETSGAANENVDNANPVDLITNTPIEGFGEEDAIDLPDAGQLTQPKHFGSGERIFANLPDSGERDPGEIQSLELNKDIPAELAEIVDDSNPVEFSINTSNTAKIIDTVIAEQSSSINLQDRDASVVKDQVTLQIESQLEVAPSENTNDTTPARSSTDLQDEGALISENQAVLEIEISNSGLADNATPVQVQSHSVAPAIENCEQVRLMPVDESPSCNQFPFVELENQIHNPVRNSSGAAETHESTSQLREYVEPQSNYLDVGPEIQGSHATCVDVSFQTNVATEGVASTTEIPHQDILQMGGVSYLPGQEAAAQKSPSMFSESLQKELERINKETEELKKSLEDTELLLNSEYKKELLELRNKYDLKHQDAREQFILKNDGLIQNRKKILLNKALADAYSYNCFWSTWPPIMLQSSPSHPSQYRQHVVRPVEATARPPAPNQQITSPFRQAVQQSSVLHSTRLGPATNQRFPDRPEQFSQHAAAAISRPQVINAVHHPTSYPRFGGAGIYSSSTPHYQASIPAAASMDVAMPTMLSTLQNPQHQQQQQHQHQRQQLPHLAAPHWLPSTQNSQQIGRQPVLSHASLSALGLLTDIQHHSQQLPVNHTSMNSSFGLLQQSRLDTTLGNVQGDQRFSAAALLMDIQHHPQQLPDNRTSMNLSFGSLQQLHLDTTLGNVQGNQRFSAAASNTICLLDDE